MYISDSDDKVIQKVSNYDKLYNAFEKSMQHDLETLASKYVKPSRIKYIV